MKKFFNELDLPPHSPTAKGIVLVCPLDLPFKGQRDYLHGPDMLQGMIVCVQERMGIRHLHDFHARLRKISTTQLELVVSNNGPIPSAPGEAAVTGKFQGDGQTYHFILRPLAQPVRAREECPQARLLSACARELSEGRARMVHPGRFSDIGEGIEGIVAMGKTLLEGTSGKPFFTGLELSDMNVLTQPGLSLAIKPSRRADFFSGEIFDRHNAVVGSILGATISQEAYRQAVSRKH
jgi:hypothetical protein